MWRFNRAAQGARRRVDSRRQPRYALSQVTSTLGDVLDLSPTGARIACGRRPPFERGHIFTLKLRAGSRQLAVTARAVRVRRTGWRQFEVGTEFLHVSSRAAAALNVLSRFGFIPSSRRDAGEAGGATSGGRHRRGRGVDAACPLPDHYATLDIARSASADEIHIAYRRLARQYHPDINKSPDAQDRFIQIKQAYEVLRDAVARQSYDMLSSGAMAVNN